MCVQSLLTTNLLVRYGNSITIRPKRKKKEKKQYCSEENKLIILLCKEFSLIKI